MARSDGAKVQLLSHRKEAIRLGSALDAQGALSLEAMQRGWACLERYAQVLGDLPRHRVRAVATQTLREASNRQIFLDEGQRILGCPIEVIDGEEEARLIYRGVAQLLPPGAQRRLVVDIGGRSTELCLGQQRQVLQARSFAFGSVTWALRHFPDGELSAQALSQAEAAVADIIAPEAGLLLPGNGAMPMAPRARPVPLSRSWPMRPAARPAGSRGRDWTGCMRSCCAQAMSTV